MRAANSFLVAFLALFLAAGVPAETPAENASRAEELVGRIVLVRTTGGGEFQGTLWTVLGDRLELVDGEGRIVPIHRPSVASIEALPTTRGKRELDFFFSDAAANRLIVMPTAFPIEPGEIHLTNQEIVAVTMSWGMTRKVSAWGGVSIPGALANLRYSVRMGEAGALSFGSFAGSTWISPISAAVMPYLIASFGDEKRNFTAAIAAPQIAAGDGAPYFAGPLVALGGKAVVSRTAALIFESWFYYSSDYGAWKNIAAYGFPACVFRIAGGRLSWDIGAVLPLWFEIAGGEPRLSGMGGDALIPLPLLSLTYRLR